MQPAGSYDQVLNALVRSERGSYGDLSYMPVFRASALFYAFCDAEFDTRIAFMNYWREKNGNPDVGVMLTVRDTQGARRARTHVRLRDMTYDFSLREMLGGVASFQGSIELEAYSPEDLKFQFPGLSVFYQSRRGSSYVHTNQRVYNDAEDRLRGASLNPWQTGFDVDMARHEPFVFVVNGPEPYDGGDIPLRWLNAQGHELATVMPLAALPAYGAVRLALGEQAGAREWLGEKPGLCKMDLPLQGVHLRLAAGNALRDGSWLSVTHSYFDATGHDDYFNAGSLPAGVAPAFIPFNLSDGMDVELVLYPIYAPASLRLSLTSYDSAGRQRFARELGAWRTPEDGLRRLDVRALLEGLGVDATEGLYVLSFDGVDGKVPARITYGLNFRRGQALGTNISASAYLLKSWGAGRRTWKWGPVVVQDGGRNLIMVSAYSPQVTDLPECEATVTLHARTGPVARRTLRLQAQDAVTLVAEDLLAEAGHAAKPGEILWYVLQSDRTTIDANQVCISADGLVGGDHAF